MQLLQHISLHHLPLHHAICHFEFERLSLYTEEPTSWISVRDRPLMTYHSMQKCQLRLTYKPIFGTFEFHLSLIQALTRFWTK